MSSGVSITGFPGIYGYASTKGAIEALTKTSSLELDRYNICVNIVHPPLTNTKSAPLGIPTQAMADPTDVGRKLAKKILSTKPVIIPDFKRLCTCSSLADTRMRLESYSAKWQKRERVKTRGRHSYNSG